LPTPVTRCNIGAERSPRQATYRSAAMLP